MKQFKQLTQAEKRVAQIYKVDVDYMGWAREIKPQLPACLTDKVQPQSHA